MTFDFKKIIPPPKVSQEQWESWTWQMQNSLKSKDDFKSFFSLKEKEVNSFSLIQEKFSVKSTPYYAAVIHQNPTLQKIALPHLKELDSKGFHQEDPLGEKAHSPTSRIIHRYPDRVLFLITDFCGIYCRYCTRKHFTGQGHHIAPQNEYQNAVEYIKNNKGIREVILSGGDPLTLSNDKIHRVLKDIRNIPHIEIIRIGSRMPVVCPFRLDTYLIKILKQYQPVFIMTHFNHPDELTFDCTQYLLRLSDSGIAVYNQMVLLNGINNHPALVQALNRRLLSLRVHPYYMFQCDPSLGTNHFRTTIQNSKWIQKELWGVLSGLALPRLSMDLPSGGGKVELTPDHLIKMAKEGSTHKGFDGVESTYYNPESSLLPDEKLMTSYLKEWHVIKNQPYGGSNCYEKKFM